MRWLPLVLIVVGLIYLLAWRPIQVRREKAHFESVAAELEKVSQDIQTKVGKPDQSKTVKSCGYASRVYTKGPLSCGTTVYLLYENKNAQQSTEIAQKIIPMFGTKSYSLDTETTDFSSQTKTDQKISQNFRVGANERVCLAEYIYPVTFDSFSDFKTKSAENIEIALTCAMDALAEHYPVR